MTQEPFQQLSTLHDTEEEDPLPVTSYTCQWVVPRKRKESTAKMSDITFEKHVYGRTRKHDLKSITDFDPRLPEFRGTVCDRLPSFLGKVRGQDLGISLLLDPSTQVWPDTINSEDSPVTLPTKEKLVERVTLFIKSLEVSSAKIRAIERHTTH